MKDSAEGNKFELHSKALTGPSAATLPITLVAHKEEVKSRWLSEIRSFALDTVALQEHATDDLRIDPNHVQQIEQVLKLPQRIDSVDPDSGIRPSDFAKDHFLTKSQRKVDDKVETQSVTEKTSSASVAAVADKSFVVQESTASEKRLPRSTVLESEGQTPVTGEKHSCPVSGEESPSKIQKVGEKASRIPVKTTADKPDTTDDTDEKKRQEEKRKSEERRKQKDEEEADRRRKEDLKILEEKRKTEEEFAKRQEELTKQQELRKLKEVEEERERKSQEEAERKVQLKNEENLRKIQEAGAIDIRVVETVKTEKAVVVEVTSAATASAETTTTTITTVTATKGDGEESRTVIKVDQAKGGGGSSDGKHNTGSSSKPSSSGNDQKASGNAKAVPLKKIASKPIEDPDPPDRKPPQRNSDGAHPPTVIPDFNPPPALVYHTTFEVSLHKEPLAPPPVPPKITHKVVVHNESLEQRTEEFLRGDSHCEFDAINYSLSSAQSKIKNIKSTFGKSKQETDLVEDTVRKVKSGEFTAIVHPPVPLHDLIPKPRPYEVVEIVTQPEEFDKLPEELQRKYDITKELLLTKKEQKMSSASSTTYHSHEGNRRDLCTWSVVLFRIR